LTLDSFDDYLMIILRMYYRIFLFINLTYGTVKN